ncbi:hypothetical protein BDK51DRAFT_24082 [Blyttiomyces helicus]|uniref:Transcription initiation factor TFIID subunit 12 domain-containing protein n=1 Tax=Blyttiomyces helicus TaxID=388810 RepID=A0A4P9W624_9FUNG|nr:hypothetical protein BDK51DRAFT_24082 [Blyttiomyces helicus]|eukprot:RKO86200.1 hypothetical protein BDK51DRAFT_24082 [Blyttiomyces helicus]
MSRLPVVSKENMRALVASVDPSGKLDIGVDDMLLEIADNFIRTLTEQACKLAKHRKSDVLDVKDAQLPLGETDDQS